MFGDKNNRDEAVNQDEPYLFFKRIEYFLWMGLAVVAVATPVMTALTYGGNPIDAVIRKWEVFIAALAFLVLPAIYLKIFGRYPLQSFFISLDKWEDEKAAAEGKEDRQRIENFNIAKKMANDSSIEYFAELAQNSRRLASSLLSRSGVHLFIGVLIAFCGLAFFYVQISQVKTEGDPSLRLIAIAPSFGILFFIEFIAFFFLKQYRASMDEFRYYEALQRYREETLGILKLLHDSGHNIDIYKLMEQCNLRTATGKLENGQSTDVLEAKKIATEDVEIIKKILDLLGKK